MNNDVSALFVFLLGCLGALAPEILRLYRLRNHSDFREFVPSQDRLIWLTFYLIVTILFAGLGGVVALLLPSQNYYAALYAGVTTPILISTMLRNATRTGRDVEGAIEYRRLVRDTINSQGAREPGGSRSGWSMPRPGTFRLFVHDYLNSL